MARDPDRHDPAVTLDARERVRFQAQLLDSVRESIIATDLDGRVIYWSRGAERLYGYSPAEALGRPVTFIVTAAEEEEERRRMQHVLEHGSWRGSYWQRRKDRSAFFAETQISLVTDSAGRPCGFVGIDRDVTDRKRAEDSLQRSERRLALVLDATSEGIWDWNVATGEVYYSTRWITSLGYAPEQVPPRVEFWESLVHPDDMPRLRRALHDHFEGRTPLYECENRLRTGAGTWRWNLDRGQVVERDARGRPLRMVGTDTDLTEVKRAEQERRAVERKLEQAQRLESLGVLAGGIAHDFNNLLTSILGNASLARQGLSQSNPLSEPLDEIETASLRAAELCKQMLAYAGRGRSNTRPFDLVELVQETLQLLQSSIGKNAVLRLDLVPAAPVLGDPAEIRQVLMNLVINASDALDNGSGLIHVASGERDVRRADLARALAPSDLPEGRYVFLEVNDDGHGMDESTQARIFDPFFTTKQRGRGLGLAAVRGIVHRHRGALQLESRPGRGSRFTLLLPRAEADVVAARSRAEPGAEWRGRGSVLLVDDESAVRAVAARMLRSLGFEVLLAENGRQALTIVRERGSEIALVLLDLTMPELGGEETQRELARLRPELPVVLMSGFDEKETAERFRAEHGPSAFLAKPFHAEALRQTLRDALSRSGKRA